jgi:hypothetical protein
MRFASVTHDGEPLAVAIDGDRATPLRDVTEIGRETPARCCANRRWPTDRCPSAT